MADFDFDLFLSYSTLDNHYGWVTDFVEHLRASLNAAVGTRDPQRIWWDRTNMGIPGRSSAWPTAPTGSGLSVGVLTTP